ncbi:DUF4855 domain-containing protein [uncultured Alistipes sp.]|uniref:DUF4855 domain-containing protein n=1 Tax=uncultured Alistipes sp. TaxID=538949 RepID=UPI0026360259|nr:DUF4855 domain-containing protein [uncultured Alistipes sp.]
MRSLSHTLLLCVFALSGISCTSCSGEKHPSPPHYEPERPDPLTAEPYAWEASRQEVPAVTDLVLLYGGGHHRSPYAWDAERLSDYVTYTDTDGKTHWLFDGFLLLEIMDPAVGEGAGVKFANGYTYNNQPLRSATREDWQRLIDYCFAEDTGIGALEQVVAAAAATLGEPAVKRRVVISIPEPIRYRDVDSKVTEYWGSVDGRSLDFADANDRVRACQWFIDTVRAEFDRRNYAYVELGGFYWLAEKDSDTSNIIGTIAAYLDDLNESFNWIPYFNAAGARQWKSYGFHYAYLQPNYFFSESVPESRLDEACELAAAAGMQLELEFDDNALNSRGMAYRLRNYMSAFRRHGVWSDKRLAYYQGSQSLRMLKNSADPADRELYHEFCRFVVTRPIRTAP